MSTKKPEPQVAHVVGLAIGVEGAMVGRRRIVERPVSHMTHAEALRLAGELSKRVNAPVEECLHTIQVRALRAEKAIAALKEYAEWLKSLGHTFKL